MALRYNVKREGIVITPYVGTIVPSHDYQYYGHAAFGERLNELQVGTYAAKLFTRGVPGIFLSGRSRTGSSSMCRTSRTTGAWATSRSATS